MLRSLLSPTATLCKDIVFGMMSIDDVHDADVDQTDVPRISFWGYKFNSDYIFLPGWELVALASCTFEVQRLRGDLIEVFRILKGYENIDQEVFLYVTIQPSWSFSKVK